MLPWPACGSRLLASLCKASGPVVRAGCAGARTSCFIAPERGGVAFLRVTGGQARGRQIQAPAGLAVRPTGAKVRQAFFNILGARVHDADFLDVFAGTGLMGIEALSRGARSLTAVEESRRTGRAIDAALEQLGYEGRVIVSDFRRALPELSGESFDIIFADPPYKSSFASRVVELVGRYELLRADGVLIVEHARAYDMPAQSPGLIRRDQRVYGQTSLSFFLRLKRE